MNIAAIIIGIENWTQYTLPLVESIRKWEPECVIAVVDNASKEPYPAMQYAIQHNDRNIQPIWTSRVCYSKAINTGHEHIAPADWYIVLSNDVLCTGPFAHLLEQYSNAIVGPQLWQINIEHVGPVDYVVGWCVAISRQGWEEIGPWDEGMQISSYEDCDYSHRARKAGYSLVADLPFVHLDQKQRFYLVPNYWDSEYHNRARFIEKHAKVTA